MSQPDPVLEPDDADGVAAALGVPGVDSVHRSTAAGNRMLIATTSAELATATPDLNAIAALQRDRELATVALVRRRRDDELHVRVFAPAHGVAEDPGTGSAAGPIGVLARRELGTDVDVTIRQGDVVGRPCTIEVHAEDGGIRVGGAVAACAEGRFTL
jgi:trans-2,3-dihydro-3-hydroxyanthranilate isomerase